MKVYNPADMNAAFAEAFNSGDIENLVSLYEPGAVLVPRPGLVAEGAEEIRAALQELLALKGVMRSENQYALVHGDIALLRAKVHLVGTAPDAACTRPPTRPLSCNLNRSGRRVMRGVRLI